MTSASENGVRVRRISTERSSPSMNSSLKKSTRPPFISSSCRPSGPSFTIHGEPGPRIVSTSRRARAIASPARTSLMSSAPLLALKLNCVPLPANHGAKDRLLAASARRRNVSSGGNELRNVRYTEIRSCHNAVVIYIYVISRAGNCETHGLPAVTTRHLALGEF